VQSASNKPVTRTRAVIAAIKYFFLMFSFSLMDIHFIRDVGIVNPLRGYMEAVKYFGNILN
jgi:hypothetical protein